MTNYPPGMTLRPLDGWPLKFTSPRREAPFRSTLSDTLKLLTRELRNLDPKDTQWPTSVLQLALSERDFRLDGMPRADSKPAHPGVILNIETRNQPALSFPCDTFWRWHDNLRAIALGLEALRKINRYGITQTGQQYRGWQAIGAPKSSPAELVDFLAKVADEGVSDTSSRNIARLLRLARFKAHPDRNGGDGTLWDGVEQAAAQLRRMGWL